jgi:ATP-dependent protease ClpP protease subunit
MGRERIIEITGEIGSWGYSMGYVKYLLDELGEGPVTVKVTSLGGDVNHALKIKDLFASHGEVTVEYISMNASAATLVGHGAKKTLIHEDSFYLIHKPGSWVEEWGYMNEDQLEEAIAKLKAQKKDAETFTLVLALDYVKVRGLELQKVLSLMKEARWLTGREAVDLGLIDGIIPQKNKRPVVTGKMLAMITANGMPVPPVPALMEKDDTESLVEKVYNKVIEKFTLKKDVDMNKEYVALNRLLNVEGLEVSGGKVTLTLEQVTAIHTKIEALEKEAAAACRAKNTAETDLSAAIRGMDELDSSVKAAVTNGEKVAAIRLLLSKRPGEPPLNPQGKKEGEGPQDDTDWEAIDKLPHNRAADREII